MQLLTECQNQECGESMMIANINEDRILTLPLLFMTHPHSLSTQSLHELFFDLFIDPNQMSHLLLLTHALPLRNVSSYLPLNVQLLEDDARI